MSSTGTVSYTHLGYHLEVLPNDNKEAVDVGLKYVNNDACYPSLMVVGQIMHCLLYTSLLCINMYTYLSCDV